MGTLIAPHPKNPYTEYELRDYTDSPESFKRMVGKSKHPQETIYYGVEVEFELNNEGINHSKNQIIESITSHINEEKFYWVGKHDGSLSGGFEFVSNPITVSSWTYFGKKVRAFFRLLRDVGCITSSCGLHIHVSKKGIVSVAHLKSLIEFMTINDDFIRKLSRRKNSSGFERYASLDGLKRIKHYEGAFIANEWHTRYLSLRPTVKTWEFRFFQGTLSWSRFLGILQTVDIIRMFTLYRLAKGLPNTPDAMYVWAKARQQKWLKRTWKYGIRELESVLSLEEKLQERARRQEERVLKEYKHVINKMNSWQQGDDGWLDFAIAQDIFYRNGETG